MPRYFLDSSALAKRYYPESGSADVELLFSEPKNRIYVSKLAIVEVQSSLIRKVREKLLSEADFFEVRTRLEDDAAIGLLEVATVGGPRLEAAALVLSTYGLVHNIRTLDAIHLATAIAIHSQRPLSGFVAADKKLLAVASESCGLQVIEV
jgi:predicted nucleic acid-binding protein